METKSHHVAFMPNLRKWNQYYNAVTNNKEATVTFPRYAKLLPQYVKAKVACTSTIDSTKLNNSKVERTKECQEAFNNKKSGKISVKTESNGNAFGARNGKT